MLVTLEDSINRRRYLNSRATLETLISLGAVPIVNENDTVATDEIRYGDNDRMAAQVAATVGADVLVLLSDVDGFYNGNPHQDTQARRYDVIDAVFALGDDDLVRVTAKARALQTFLDTDDGAALLAGYNRASNIVRAEEKKDGDDKDGDGDDHDHDHGGDKKGDAKKDAKPAIKKVAPKKAPVSNPKASPL